MLEQIFFCPFGSAADWTFPVHSKFSITDIHSQPFTACLNCTFLLYGPYHMAISAWLKGKLSEFKKKTSTFFQLITGTIKAAQRGSRRGTQWRWTYWHKESSWMKHHNTHTNIRDFTVWKTHRMKHGSRSEVTDRVEKMPTPYLKANKRNSHPEMTLDKKTKRKNKLKKKTHLFLSLFSCCFKYFYLRVQACGQRTMCGQFCTSTVRVTAPTSGVTATASTHWDI